ncbi:MAG: hypothetical protein JWO13_2342 [Acidobacteriales bacterium]|nr:hypothetical protein [Terriglobales bacterium]
MLSIDLKSLTDHKFQELFAPFVPGLIVAFGLGIGTLPKFVASTGFEPSHLYLKFSIGLIGSYLIGLSLFCAIVLADLIAMLMMGILIKSLASQKASEEPIWRAMVGLWLTPALVPKISVPAASLNQTLDALVRSGYKPTDKDRLNQSEAYAADSSWTRIHSVLNSYFNLSTKIKPEEGFSFVMVHSIAISWLIFQLLTHQVINYHWSVWLLVVLLNCLAFVLMPLLYWSAMMSSQNPDLQSAEILKLLKSIDAAAAKSATA